MEKLGYIGLGIMGKPMVENLTKAGHKVNVYARRQASVDALNVDNKTDNIEVFSNPAELAEASTITISCVSDTCDVEEVLTGPAGALQGVQVDSLVIDMSTISPEATRLMSAQFLSKEVGMLDAPVSGGEVGAIAASLSIMVGGEEKDFQRALPIFECLGKNIVHVGSSGAGQVAKACNQILVAQTMTAVAEAFLLAQSADVDPIKVREALLGGFAYSKILEFHGQRMLDKSYAPGFKANLHAKDLRLALESAHAHHIDMPGTELSNEYMQQLVAQGDGELDSAAIAKIVGSG